jgi:hypothetical protein
MDLSPPGQRLILMQLPHGVQVAPEWVFYGLQVTLTNGKSGV